MARARDLLLNPYAYIDVEVLAGFSYTGTRKTEQGGDNQAQHVV